MHIRLIHSSVGRQLATLLLAATASLPVHSYEADVHYGLTRWLAQKAGYADWQARAIATGNFRVDSGLMSTLALLPQYACVGKDFAAAREIQERHYPSNSKVPADAHQRAVEPGSAAAREMLTIALQKAKGHEAQHLGLFGAALHPLQDSWAHAGVPTLPVFGPVSCDAQLAAAPPARGKEGPHAADLTFLSPVSTVAMARATYEALTAFPSIKGEQRSALKWSALEPSVRAFAEARTKTAKRDWFVKQGMADTEFLEGITLPDGPDPGPLKFEGRNLPALQKAPSMQHDASADTREFFDRLMARWLGNEPVEIVVADLAKQQVAGPKESAAASRKEAQLATRMKVWKLRDHGSAAHLAHLKRPYTSAEIAQVNALGKQPAANVAGPVEQAFFPVVTGGPTPSPLLPYILHILPGQDASAPRAIAVARLKHAPRDTIGLLAEKTSSGWRLVDLVFVIDQ
ncbi:MAG TPA: hypothetical protein VHL79_21630 [Ramlibacter sp.]|jgi:hypothetical protein|nr:hypothetical protein [Ramlibacter sp.]